jgi:glutaredoxin 2
VGRTGSSDRRGVVKLCPVCEKFRMAGIKGIAIAICGDCLAKVDEERTTITNVGAKKRKKQND